MNDVKIALAMIVKGDSEKDDFENLLKTFMPHVDGLYVAVTGIESHDKIHAIVKKYKGTSVSTSPETHPQIYIDGKFAHFAEARNVSFSLVPKEYDFVTWADTDDLLLNGSELRECARIAKEKDIDSVFFTYWYAVDFTPEGRVREVVIDQLRERLLKNGVFKWISRLHEVAVPKDENYVARNTAWDLTDGRKCVWLHTARFEEFAKTIERNTRILRVQAEEEGYKDPRTLGYLAKSLFDKGDDESLKEAKGLIQKNLESNGWDADRSMMIEYLGMIFEKEKNYTKAIQAYHTCIQEYPNNLFPYLRLAEAYYNTGKVEFGKRWLDIASNMDFPTASTTIGNPRDLKVATAGLKLRQAMIDRNPQEMMHWADVRAKLMNEEDELYQGIKDTYVSNEAARGLLNYAKWLKDKGYMKNIDVLLDSVPPEFESLPFVYTISNAVREPKKWGSKSIVYYASFGAPHFEKWDFESMKKGIGGSETAVISLSEQWAKKGYEVTVFADIFEPKVSPNGVQWKPYYSINWNDEFNILILWRSPHLIDVVKHTKKLYMDLHDVASQLDWTVERMKKVDKVFFKSQYHRNNVPKLPDSKAVVISNGIVL